ncbi:MAG TPA: hypothetical protein VJ951_12080 [Bacteroidales bacterium]|nr:hypothetical protein [Bacteroidales bacterium]
MKISKRIIVTLFVIGGLFFTSLTAQQISPYLFGQNLWLTEGAEGRPGYIDQIWPKVEQSGVEIIRIGGAGYDRNMPPLDTLIHWVKSIKAIGAEPLLQVSKFQSAQQAADLVKYFNQSEDLYIRFWSIGNEPYHMDKFSVDSISDYIKTHATAMKAVDDKIKIFVPDLAAYYNNVYEALLKDDELSVAGRDENGNCYIDGINFHNYPNAKDYNRSDVIFFSVSKMRGMVMDLKKDIAYANEKYARNGEDALSWSITEFNITYDNPDDLSPGGIAVPSFINGQFWVDIFCMAMEYEAFTVTPWCIQESDRPRTYFGYVGGPPEFIPHSTYYHMQMLAENMNGEYIKMNTSSPFFKAFGSVDKGVTTIVLMNQHEEQFVEADLNKINTKADNSAIAISSSRDIQANFKVRSAPNSTTLLQFDDQGRKIKELLYTQKMAIQNEPPQIIK